MVISLCKDIFSFCLRDFKVFQIGYIVLPACFWVYPGGLKNPENFTCKASNGFANLPSAQLEAQISPQILLLHQQTLQCFWPPPSFYLFPPRHPSSTQVQSPLISLHCKIHLEILKLSVITLTFRR